MAKLQANPCNMDELLICGVCEEPYDHGAHQAKFLTCFHTYCSQCLTKLSNLEQVKPAIIPCPSCRSQTRVPRNGVHGLQTNFYVTRFQEFSGNTESLRNTHGCHRHNMEPLSHCCVTCRIPICHDCRVLNHTAKDGHSVIGISKEEIAYIHQLNVSNTSITLLKKNLKLIESEVRLLAAAKQTAVKDMETFIKHAHAKLEQRRTDLMNLISDQFNELQKSLLEKQKQIKNAVKNISEDIIQAKNMIKTGDLSRLKTISDSMTKVNGEIQSTSSSLDLGENYLAFDANQGTDIFDKCLSTLGQVYCKGCLPNTIAFSSTEAKAGHKTKLTVEVYNHHGNMMPLSSDSISVQVLDPTDTSLPIARCASSSECTVTFTPQMSGLHEVSGKFIGKKLIGEHTHISVGSINPVLKFGENDNGFLPWAIAIDNDNCLYVADCNNKLIKKFTADGELLSQFSVAVNGKDHTTLDIALDSKGQILCTDLVDDNNVIDEGNSILEFNLEGELKHTYTLTDPWKAYCLTIDRNDDIILTTRQKHCLFKIDRCGNILSSMGSLKSPGYMAIGKDGAIIVPDEGDDCIYIFNPNGGIRHKFGSSGAGKGQLSQPSGVATDGEYILVSESKNNRIQVFRYDGTLVSMIESLEDPLNYPTGLAVTGDGYVYVADADNHCIKKYRYRDVSWWQ